MTQTFGERVGEALSARGPLCAGIDPHASLLDSWGLDQSAAGVREFGLRVVDAAAERVGFVKPQVSFFERFGSAGFAALEDVLRAARDAGLIVIADAKRGDIGSTMDGYLGAWLTAGSPLEADAVTLSPYLGADSLRETLLAAVKAHKGAFVLVATSNPEAYPLQSARSIDVAATEDQSVAERVARDTGWINASAAFADTLGPIGFVVGATADRDRVGLSDDALRSAPILAPGFGAQGATADDLPRLFGALSANVIANESRSILSAGPDGLVTAIDQSVAAFRKALNV